MTLPDRAPSLRPRRSLADHFIDRQQHSEALAEGLRAHLDRCDAGEINDRVFRNIITFYGMSGMGKTELSKSLENWITGRPSPDGWGTPPAVPGIATARWALNDSRGNLDIVPLLIAVRVALHGARPSWPDFDLPFAAYLTSVQRTADLAPAITRDLLDGIGAPELTASAIGELATHSGDNELLTRCLTEPGRDDQSPELAADLLWRLSVSISGLAPSERPNLVVFVDPFEKVQNADRGTGEPTINRLVTSLPFALFVITGQRYLDWHHETRTDLAIFGAAAWPDLVIGQTEGARQHLLDHLAMEDRIALLRRFREVHHLPIADDVLEAVAASSGGWPVHLDTAVAIAVYRRDHFEDEPITMEHLGGKLPELVARLLTGLPDDEARVFQAACVLPFFDPDLVQAVAGNVDGGSVQRCIERTLVLPNPGSDYPFRVHDEIRSIVRRSAATVHRGWNEKDWADAAERASAHIRARREAAQAQQQDLAELQAIALGIHLAAESTVDAEWIAAAVRTGPGITSLRPFIPSSDRVPEASPVHGLVRFIEVMDAKADDSTPDQLLRLSEDPLITGSSLLWRAYRLRDPLHRYDEAVDQLEQLATDRPGKRDLYLYQAAITLTQARRYRTALTYGDRMAADRTRLLVGSIARIHGDLSSVTLQIERAENQINNRRFAIELAGEHTVTRARRGEVTLDEIAERLAQARDIGNRVAERMLLQARGYSELLDDDAIELTLLGMSALRKGSGVTVAEMELLTLRSLATGDLRHAERVAAIAADLPTRPHGWIPTEIWLSQLGIDVPAIQTDWVDDPALVAQRWRDIGADIVERAQAR